MSEPYVERFMTHDPITIARDQSLNRARRVMRTHCIRHLPVVHDGRLVGVISERDLYRFDSLIDINQDYLTVGEGMTKEPYAVSAHSPLREAVAQMASRRCGSAIVVEGQRVVGLLTATDGLRALAVVIEEQLNQVS
jgi:acetoin utilization protein AcuB